MRAIDSREPEPFGALFRVFITAAILLIPMVIGQFAIGSFVNGIFAGSAILYIFASSFFVDALFEEYTKFFVLQVKIVKKTVFDEYIDGIVYGGAAGLGVAFGENIIGITTAWSQEFSGFTGIAGNFLSVTSFIFDRIASANLLHLMGGALSGLFLAAAKLHPKLSRWPFLVGHGGIWLAILFHGLYNSVARLDVQWYYILMALLFTIFYIVIVITLRLLRRTPTIGGKTL